MKGKCPDCGEEFEFPSKARVDVLLFGNWRKYHFCKREFLILNPISSRHKYAIHLQLKDFHELEHVRKALKPLGITLRFPRR